MRGSRKVLLGVSAVTCLTIATSLIANDAIGQSQTNTALAINNADLTALVLPATPAMPAADDSPKTLDPAIAKLEIMLDRAGASPGVIDGFDGENLRKAIDAYEMMVGLKLDGVTSPALLQSFPSTAASPVMGFYTITKDDEAVIVPPLPKDYAEMAKLKVLGYTSVAEELAERFHMDQKLLKTINPTAKFTAGEEIYVTLVGEPKTGKVARIEADKAFRQVRAYDADGKLLVAYPATIGSTDTPSPTGHYTVVAVAPNPTYTYNPQVNFKQGDNDQKLILPPGPNGPVGSVYIALSKPTFGIHGTPEPSLIDKAASHGCIRLTNWDAEELSKMVSKGVSVDFVP